jgi:hypothetical protein
MSRNLGWGKSFSCNESLTEKLKELEGGDIVVLDRWKVVCTPLDEEEIEATTAKLNKRKQKDKKPKLKQEDEEESDRNKDEGKEKEEGTEHKEKGKEKENEKGKEKEKEKGKGKEKKKGKSSSSSDEAEGSEIPKKLACVMNNYCSFGSDAKIVLGILILLYYYFMFKTNKLNLDFHKLRERRGDLFTDRMLNMGWYAGISATTVFHNILNYEGSKLKNIAILKIDGKVIRIPKHVRSIVVMNLLTYGGTKCWGSKPAESGIEPSFNDGVLEVIAMYIFLFYVFFLFLI